MQLRELFLLAQALKLQSDTCSRIGDYADGRAFETA